MATLHDDASWSVIRKLSAYTLQLRKASRSIVVELWKNHAKYTPAACHITFQLGKAMFLKCKTHHVVAMVTEVMSAGYAGVSIGSVGTAEGSQSSILSTTLSVPTIPPLTMSCLAQSSAASYSLSASSES
jgi:hypothetical protein